VCVCVCVRMCVHMCVFLCVYTHSHTHISASVRAPRIGERSRIGDGTTASGLRNGSAQSAPTNNHPIARERARARDASSGAAASACEYGVGGRDAPLYLPCLVLCGRPHSRCTGRDAHRRPRATRATHARARVATRREGETPRRDLSASDPSPSFIANNDSRGDGGAGGAPVCDGGLGTAARNEARGSDGPATSDDGADDPALDSRAEAAAASSDGKATAPKETKQTHKQTNKQTNKASVGRWPRRDREIQQSIRAAREARGRPRMAESRRKGQVRVTGGKGTVVYTETPAGRNQNGTDLRSARGGSRTSRRRTPAATQAWVGSPLGVV
jgi:hypothetical protein